jgi:hypothetical protein
MVAWPSFPDVLQVRFQKEQGAANVAEEKLSAGQGEERRRASSL